MERDSVRIARESWRKPPDYRVRGPLLQSTVNIVAWARRPPYIFWIIKWPLAVLGLLVLWTFGWVRSWSPY